jgi:serine/threonine protein kinase
MADEVRPFLGGLLKEIIIQTRLMMDKTYGGRFIPKLIAVYRTVNFYKESMYYILKMEYLDMTYRQYIQTYIDSPYGNVNEKKTVTSNLLLANMIDILNILKYFFTTYSFQHFDIHPDNIMYSSKTYTYKLIDFGYDSYIKIGPYTIGRLDYVSYNKYDVFSLVETYRRDMNQSVYTANFQAKLDKLATIGPSLDYDECLKILNDRNGGRRNRSRMTRRTRKKRALL